MMKLSEKDARELFKKIGIHDPVSEEREQKRSKRIDLKTLPETGVVRDPKPAATKRTKSGIVLKLLLMIYGYILAWWNAPRSRQAAPRRPAKRRTPSTRSKKPAPIRLEPRAWKDPSFIEPDFSGSARFANGPNW